MCIPDRVKFKALKGGEEKAREFLVEAKAMKARAEQEKRERKEREERERKEREEKELIEREKREEIERKEREHQEWLATEEGQKWQAEEKRRENKRKRKETAIKILKVLGVFLQIGAAVTYLIILWGTDIVRSLWLETALLGMLPLAVFPVSIGIIGVIFLRKSGFSYIIFSAVILIIIIIMQAITACVWTGNVGFLFINFIGRLVLNIISVIPGAHLLLLQMEK